MRRLALLVLLLLPGAQSFAVEKPAVKAGWVAEFLKTRLGLTEAELAKAARGEIVARMVEDRGDREIATIGVISLAKPPATWSADYELAERIRRSNPDLISIGRFHAPPKDEDFAGVELDDKALPVIRKCRPTACTLNLPADALNALKHEIDANPPNFEAAADAVFRRLLREVAHKYQESGDASLPVFTNRPRLVPTSDASALLLSRTPSLPQVAPQVARRLRECHHPSADCPSFIHYWYREKSWKHEVIGLVQAAFEEEAIGTGHYRALVEKTFYANHYFRGALAVTGVLEDPAGSYLFYLNRSETDNGGAFNFIERALAGYLIPRRVLHQMDAFRAGFAGLAIPPAPPIEP